MKILNMTRIYVYLVSTFAAVIAEGGAVGATQGDSARWLAPNKVQAIEIGFPVSGGGEDLLFPGMEPLVLLLIGSALIFFGAWRWRKGADLAAQSGKELPRWKR